jgi:hypothetical protein
MESNVTFLPHTASSSRGSRLAADRTLDLVSWGVPFRLVAETTTLLNRMRKSTPYGSVPCPIPSPCAHTFVLLRSNTRSRFQLLCNQELIAEDESLDRILDQLGGHLIIHVAKYAPDYVFVHAGVVAWRGRGLVLPGVSFAGKSTLVAELVRAGATYYSDEFALVDREGLVHPFPRDLRMRRPGQAEQMPVPIEQLQGRAGTTSVPIAMVVFTRFEIEGCWTPEPLSPGRAALELLLHTLPVQRTPTRVLATFAAMMRQARAWRTARGESAAAAAALLSALATEGALA